MFKAELPSERLHLLGASSFPPGNPANSRAASEREAISMCPACSPGPGQAAAQPLCKMPEILEEDLRRESCGASFLAVFSGILLLSEVWQELVVAFYKERRTMFCFIAYMAVLRI